MAKRNTHKFYRSHVNWAERKSSLSSVDYVQINRPLNTDIYGQHTIAHEFGHTVDNVHSFTHMHSDEYNTESSYYHDKNSIRQCILKSIVDETFLANVIFKNKHLISHLGG